MFELTNKIAIVTGAAHGIGKSIAEVFAEAGAAVMLVDLDEEAGESAAAAIRKKGQAASFVKVDVADEKQIAAAVKIAGDRTGRIDVLCNNAAYLSTWHNLLDAPREEWEISIAVTLMGSAYFMRETLPYMLPHKAGSIINVSSVQGMIGARTSAAYTTMKHGVIGLTRSAAYDFGPQNIRINALCPGLIQTRISPKPGEELHQRQISKTFLNRVGQPREVAHAALFLASDEASYITGAVIPVDGGWTAM